MKSYLNLLITLFLFTVVNVRCVDISESDSVTTSEDTHPTPEIEVRNEGQELNEIHDNNKETSEAHNEAIQETKETTITPKFIESRMTNDHYRIYVYSIDENTMYDSSNSIKQIWFTHQLLDFENQARMPKDRVTSVFIYTCYHNKPILIRLTTRNGHSFYSLNPETGKWSMYKIESMKEYEDKDENGVIYYKHYGFIRGDSQNMNNSINMECLLLSWKLYKDHNNVPADILEGPFLEIFL